MNLNRPTVPILLIMITLLLGCYKKNEQTKSTQQAFSVAKEEKVYEEENARFYYDVGVALKRVGKFEEAITNLQKAIELNPKFAGAYNCLGDIFYNQLKYKEAMTNFRKAIKIDATFAAAYNNLGVVLYEESGSFYSTAILFEEEARSEALSHTASLQFSVAWRYLEDAITNYRNAIKFDIDFAAAYNNLGTALVVKKQFEQAIMNFKKAIELAPGDPFAYHNLATVLRYLGEFEKAKIYSQKLRNLNNKAQAAEFKDKEGLQTLHWYNSFWTPPNVKQGHVEERKKSNSKHKIATVKGRLKRVTYIYSGIVWWINGSIQMEGTDKPQKVNVHIPILFDVHKIKKVGHGKIYEIKVRRLTKPLYLPFWTRPWPSRFRGQMIEWEAIQIRVHNQSQ